jgi:CRP/FNR family transcriptional regulator
VLVPTGVEAVTPARVLYLNHERLRAAAQSDLSVAWALMRQLVLYQRDIIHLMAGTAFGSIRQRVAMHLLNLAKSRLDGQLIAPVTQQALADAVGTTRETAARALSELRAAGAISGERGRIHLRDPEQLAAEVYPVTGV